MSPHQLLAHYGYTGIAVALILEFLLIPFPAETILVFSGVMWHQGVFHIVPLLFVAIFSSWAGSLLAYLLGSYVGRPILVKLGRYVGLTEAKLHKAEVVFRHYSLPILGLGRFIAGIRVLIAYVAGMNKIGFGLYAIITFVSASLWAAVFIFLGGTVSAKWHLIVTWSFTHPIFATLIGLLVAAVLYFVWRLKHKIIKVDNQQKALSTKYVPEKPDAP